METNYKFPNVNHNLFPQKKNFLNVLSATVSKPAFLRRRWEKYWVSLENMFPFLSVA